MSSYRYLTLRRERHIMNQTVPELLAGEIRLFSYYMPSLQGGKHTVTVSQNVKENPSENGLDIKPARQEFYVAAPQFSVPAECVNSIYPPPGQSVEARILPHMVFNDPHLPWERTVWDQSDKNDNRNQVPWFILLTFTADELQLSPQELANILPGQVSKQQTETLSVGMKTTDLSQLKNVIRTMPKPNSVQIDETVEVIFIKQDLFNSLFMISNQLDVKKFRFMSHVRKVGLDGTVAAKEAEVGIYSLTVSNRTGPVDIERVTTTFVHLVAIDYFSKRTSGGPEDRVALTSLYSWSYSTLPPTTFNVSRTLEKLGRSITVMGSNSQPQLQSDPAPEDRLDEIIARRQYDGYTIARHRTITGEQTVSMTRGPLVPTTVPYKLKDSLRLTSNFGTDLQIIDPDTSLMDITYAAAWQLGKTLAIGDAAFTAALARLRTTIHREAVKRSKQDVHRDLNYFQSREEVARNMIDLVTRLNKLNAKLRAEQKIALSRNRWKCGKDSDDIDISLQSPHIRTRYWRHADAVASQFSLASDDTSLYNEHNVPSNTDYAAVYSWVLNKLYLADIPAHYLIPGPSFLPPESLRFFNVDENWTDAMVDGALSLANHWGNTPDKDECRIAIKTAIENKVHSPDPKLRYVTQMPVFGFVMRSQLLVLFPDLMLQAQYKSSTADDKRNLTASILVQRKLSDETMLVLFDRKPPDLTLLTFTMPPHQQCFAIGSDLNAANLHIKVKGIYTKPEGTTAEERRRPILVPPKFDRGRSEFFDWNSRTLQVEKFVTFVLKTNQEVLKEKFTDSATTSTLLALQLNDPIFCLEIAPKEHGGVIPPLEKALFQFSIPKRSIDLQNVPKLFPPLPEAQPPISRVRRPRPALPKPMAVPGLQIPSPSKVLIPTGPIFDFNVFPVSRSAYIPTDGKLPFDLVFNIRYREGDMSYPLTRIRVTVPRGQQTDMIPLPPPNLSSLSTGTTTAPPEATKPLLAASYDASLGPQMLSNLRFNVLKSFSPDKKLLNLDVIPRTANGILVERIREASFLLPLVNVVNWKTREEAWVSCVHEYKEFNDKIFNNGKYVVMKPAVST